MKFTQFDLQPTSMEPAEIYEIDNKAALLGKYVTDDYAATHFEHPLFKKAMETMFCYAYRIDEKGFTDRFQS